MIFKKLKSFENYIWSFGQQFSLKIVAFIVQIILARLLMPEDFGLVALIMIFITIGQSLADGGMRSSLIRTIDAGEDDYSTVFVINVLISLVVYGIIYLSAPFIADFYNIEQLTGIIRVLSLSFIIKAFNIVQATIVVKELNFRKNFLIQLPSNIIASFVGVILAYQGFGVWSLIYMTLTESFINTLTFWLTSKWRPQFIFKKDIYLKHFNFGYKLTIASVLNTIFQNIYTIVIGKVYSPLLVGLYNRAESFNSFPVRMSITSVKSVTYPMLSKLGNDNKNLKASYRQIMLQMIFWITPVLILMCINADNLFYIILTDKWNAAVPFFKILCIASIFYPLQEYNLQVLDIKGRSDIYLRIELIKKIITVIVLAIALNFSIYYLLYSQILLNIIFFVIGAVISGKLIDYHISEQIKDISLTFIVNLFLGVGFYVLHTNIYFENKYLDVIGLSLLFMVMYIVINFILKAEPLDLIKSKWYVKR